MAHWRLRWCQSSVHPWHPLQKFCVYTHTHTHTHPRAHTHTRPEPGQPWKARGREKADTNDGPKAETAQGGEGNKRASRTNLHGETDLTNTEHTPKPHDTFQRGTGEKLGPNGGLVDDEKWNNKLTLKGFSSILESRALLPKRGRCRSGHMGIKRRYNLVQMN